MSTTPEAKKNIVIVGGGIQASSIAYHLSQSTHLPAQSTITILESVKLASAASGKGGGFMARSWGDGGPTQSLHEVSFDLYESLAQEIGISTYRKLPVLSVRPGKGGTKSASGEVANVIPGWLDGNVGYLRLLGGGDDTAQVTPEEVVSKFVEKSGANVCLGTMTGVAIAATKYQGDGPRKIKGVKYIPKDSTEETTLECDTVIVSAGPWSCAAEDWFDNAVKLPMEGIKSTSIVWKAPSDSNPVDATALFCGEDDRFGTHLECYPRPDNTIYLCGIGGSDYITTAELKKGAFRDECTAKEKRVEAAKQSFMEMSKQYRSSGELQQTQACMRPCPPDALPYMGPIPGFEGAYINAGHNCWGIAWAPGCGLAMSELVLEGESTTIDLSPFDPRRFTPSFIQRGGRGRKRQGQSLGEQW